MARLRFAAAAAPFFMICNPAQGSGDSGYRLLGFAETEVEVCDSATLETGCRDIAVDDIGTPRSILQIEGSSVLIQAANKQFWVLADDIKTDPSISLRKGTLRPARGPENGTSETAGSRGFGE